MFPCRQRGRRHPVLREHVQLGVAERTSRLIGELAADRDALAVGNAHGALRAGAGRQANLNRTGALARLGLLGRHRRSRRRRDRHQAIPGGCLERVLDLDLRRRLDDPDVAGGVNGPEFERVEAVPQAARVDRERRCLRRRARVEVGEPAVLSVRREVPRAHDPPVEADLDAGDAAVLIGGSKRHLARAVLGITGEQRPARELHVRQDRFVELDLRAKHLEHPRAREVAVGAVPAGRAVEPEVDAIVASPERRPGPGRDGVVPSGRARDRHGARVHERRCTPPREPRREPDPQAHDPDRGGRGRSLEVEARRASRVRPRRAARNEESEPAAGGDAVIEGPHVCGRGRTSMTRSADRCGRVDCSSRFCRYPHRPPRARTTPGPRPRASRSQHNELLRGEAPRNPSFCSLPSPSVEVVGFVRAASMQIRPRPAA